MVRYYEKGNISAAKKQSDFIFRRRHGNIVRSMLLYGFGLIAIFIVAYFKETIGGDTPFLTIIALIITALTLNSVITLQKHLDLVTSIEFQNALFSSAFREGKLFSLIVSQDDQMYYADSGFYRLFPDLVKNSAQVLDAIVSDSHTSKANLAMLNTALITKEQATFDVNITNEGQRMKARMSIIPLPRPSGYFFVSARLFAEMRENVNGGISRSEEAKSILSVLCEQVSDLAYVVDSESNIMCATQPFVEYVGYNHISQLEGKKITDFLRSDVKQLSVNDQFSDEPQTYKADLQPLKGSLKNVMITQVHIHNAKEDIAFTVGKVTI